MSMLHIVVSVLGTVLVLASLPLLLELLVLSVTASLPLRPVPLPKVAGVRLAVIVPAHNEEMLIGPCVESILASAEANVPVYVIAHNCQDKTAERAREAGANVFRLWDGVGGRERRWILDLRKP